jgi:FG-GAP-like repeat
MSKLAARLPRFIAATLVALSTTAPALADTLINGGEVGGQTWTPAGSPYLIKGDITIAAGTTLRMLPGTQVHVFAGDLQAAGLDPTAVEITVKGELIAEDVDIVPNGLIGAGATFYDRWHGIVIDPEATRVKITNSWLQAGGACITYRHPGAILDVAGTTISNASAFTRIGSAASGVGIRVESGAPLIERVTFGQNQGAVLVFFGGRPFIRSSRFLTGMTVAPRHRNVAIDIMGTDATAAPIRIFNNTFDAGDEGAPAISIYPGVPGLTVDIVNNSFLVPIPNGISISEQAIPATVNIHYNMFEDIGAISGVTLGTGNFQGTGAAGIDRGTNAVDVPTDLVGNPRPRRLVMDVGAYENPGTIMRGDVNGDLKADLFWREAAPGVGLSWWTMDGPAIAGANYLEVPAEWQISDMGDFNGDGKSDLLWRRADGATYLWTLDGLAPTGFFDLGIVSPAAWTLVGAADLDGNGRADLVWRNNGTGAFYGWLMFDGAISSQGALGGPIGAEWQAIKLADMDGDGKTDIVLRNTTTGEIVIWFMNGLVIGHAASVGEVVNPALWTVVSVADFNGDGKADFLWMSTANELVVWLMDGAAKTSSGFLAAHPGAGWSIKSVSDFDGDGKADILWRHTDGSTLFWKVDGISVPSQGPVANPGGSWQVVAP